MASVRLYGYTNQESYDPESIVDLHMATDQSGDAREYSFIIERMGPRIEQVIPVSVTGADDSPLPQRAGRYVIVLHHKPFPLLQDTAINTGGDCQWPVSFQ